MNTEIAANNLYQLSPGVSKIYLNRVLLNARYLQSVLRLSESTGETGFSPQQALAELMALNGETKLKRHLVSRISLPEDCLLTGNKLAFQEMLVCLINNAYESYESRRHYKMVFLSAVAERETLAVSVTDGGRGMSWFAQKLSTTQLYSTKKDHSGLGLYFVKKTLEQEFAGRFRIYSKLDKGTTITLHFPLKRYQPIAKAAFRLQY